MRAFFPSSIATDTFIAQPLDVKEWDEDVFSALMSSDCLEIDGMCYWWNKFRTVVKRAPIAQLIVPLRIKWDKPKSKGRQVFLSINAKRNRTPIPNTQMVLA
jgi:hypothetical protein